MCPVCAYRETTFGRSDDPRPLSKIQLRSFRILSRLCIVILGCLCFGQGPAMMYDHSLTISLQYCDNQSGDYE